jgi:hypothetical protein
MIFDSIIWRLVSIAEGTSRHESDISSNHYDKGHTYNRFSNSKNFVTCRSSIDRSFPFPISVPPVLITKYSSREFIH